MAEAGGGQWLRGGTTKRWSPCRGKQEVKRTAGFDPFETFTPPAQRLDASPKKRSLTLSFFVVLADLLARTLRELASGVHDLEAMGARGRAYVEAEADREVAIERYRELLAEVNGAA